MELVERSTAVKIRGEDFSLESSPDEGSKLVQKQKELLLGDVRLKDLSGNLGRVGKLVRLAYFGAKGCGYGPGMVELKMSIYELGTSVTKLGSIASSTVSSFKSSSYEVIQELQAAAEYLLEGYEEDALECLESLTETAKHMSSEANSLKIKFEEKQKDVEAVIHKLETVENERGQERDKIKTQKSELDIEIKKLKEKKANLKALEEEAKAKRKEYESKINEEIDNYKEPGFFTWLRRELTGTEDEGSVKIRDWKKLRLEYLETECKQRELYNKQLEEEFKSISALENCKGIEGDLSTAIKCLQEVTHALKHLQDIMGQAVQFWERLHVECSNLSHSKIQKAIVKGKDGDKESRLEKWHSRRFKTDAVCYCAKWVALHSICHDYIENVKYTQAELRSYNTENPSVEDAQRMLPVLVRQLKEDTVQMMTDNRKHITDTADEIQEVQRGADS